MRARHYRSLVAAGVVALLVALVLAAGLRSQWRYARAMAALQSCGAKTDAIPVGPKWIRRLRDKSPLVARWWRFERDRSVLFRGDPPPDWPQLVRDVGASRLYVSGSKVSQDFGRTVAALPALEDLWCEEVPLRDEQLAGLLPRSGMQRVVIQDALLTPAALASLKVWPQLTRLDLSGCAQFTGPGWADIVTFAQLEELYLTAAGVRDDDLRWIGRLSHLKCLSLAHTAVTDAGLAHLEGCAALEVLTLSSTAVGDAGVQALTKLSRLRYLQLGRTRITPASLPVLASMPDLEYFTSDHTAIAERGDGFVNLVGKGNRKWWSRDYMIAEPPWSRRSVERDRVIALFPAPPSLKKYLATRGDDPSYR